MVRDMARCLQIWPAAKSHDPVDGTHGIDEVKQPAYDPRSSRE